VDITDFFRHAAGGQSRRCWVSRQWDDVVLLGERPGGGVGHRSRLRLNAWRAGRIL